MSNRHAVLELRPRSCACCLHRQSTWARVPCPRRSPLADSQLHPLLLLRHASDLTQRCGAPAHDSTPSKSPRGAPSPSTASCRVRAQGCRHEALVTQSLPLNDLPGLGTTPAENAAALPAMMLPVKEGKRLLALSARADLVVGDPDGALAHLLARSGDRISSGGTSAGSIRRCQSSSFASAAAFLPLSIVAQSVLAQLRKHFLDLLHGAFLNHDGPRHVRSRDVAGVIVKPRKGSGASELQVNVALLCDGLRWIHSEHNYIPRRLSSNCQDIDMLPKK